MGDNHFVPLCVKSTGHLSRATHGNETESGSDRSATHRGGSPAQAQGAAGAGGASARGFAAIGEPVGATVGRGQRSGRQAQRQVPWAAAVARRRPMREAAQSTAQRRPARRLSDRAVDGETRAGTGQARVRRCVQQHRMLAAAAQPRILTAEAGEAGAATRRGGDRGLEAQDVAGAKKTPGAKGEP